MKKEVLFFYFSLLLCNISIASTYVPCTADEEGSCWRCGETCSARLTYDNAEDAANHQNATITYSGTGKMYNFDAPKDNPELIGVEPWYLYREAITKAVVEEGITSVGNRSVYNMPNLKEVSLPDTITSIGGYAFYQANLLEKINIPDSVTYIGSRAFYKTGVEEIVIPEGVTNLAGAFRCESQVSALECRELMSLQKIYCSKENYEACKEAVAHLDITPTLYEKSGDQYISEGKFFSNLNDLALHNYAKKRIYTVEEAVQISGKKNKLTIKYK